MAAVYVILTLTLSLILTLIYTNLPNKRNISAFQYVNMLQCTIAHAWTAGEHCLMIGYHV